MKKIIALAAFSLFACSVFAKDIKELVVTTLPPMSCQNCENKIKGNLRFEKGVKKIETNLGEQRVTIEYDADKTNVENIENAFQKIGYNVEVINPETQKADGEKQPAASSACNGGCGGCCKK